MKTTGVLFFWIAAISVPLCAQQPAPQTASPKPAGAAAHTARKPTTTASTSAAANHSLLKPALLNAKAPEVFKARFITSKGDFVVEAHREWSPLGADRFYNLVKNGFYNGGGFFRIVPGFVVQFGLSPTPAISAAWHEATIQDDPVTQTNTKGSVTFATSGPNSRTTQLFINLGENTRLDKMGFSPFGTVIEGMEVLETLYSGYGEGPDQGQIEEQGKAYIDKNFPLLDGIKAAKLEGIAAPPATVKKAVPAAAKKRSAPANP